VVLVTQLARDKNEKKKKIWPSVSDVCLTPRQAGRLTVLTSTLTMLQVLCMQPASWEWCAGGCPGACKKGNCHTPASYRGRNHAKQELQGRRTLRAATPRSFSKYITADRSLPAALCGPISVIGGNHHNTNSNSLHASRHRSNPRPVRAG
jgi:hypothetical protein